VPLSYDATGRAKLYADIAHPVNAACREKIQNRIVEELKRELELASQPGYRSRYDDDYDDDFDVADYSDLQRTKSKMPHDDELMPGSMHPPRLAPLEETTKRLDLAAPAPPSPHDGLSPNETSDPVANPNQGTDEFGKGIF
jgi:stage V sporulation protein G